MALPSPALAPPESQSHRQAQVFEFTKRKKWADILISELPETVLLVLDTDGEIQYVGPNTTDVLGWEVEELAETDVLDIVNDVDKITFNAHLRKSLSSRQDLSCYARLKCKPVGKPNSEQGTSQKELLFEIRGHPLSFPDDNECKILTLVARPYPSRNMAVLNTFLELKIENERLTQRHRELKAQDLMPGAIDDMHPPMSTNAMSHPQFASFEFPTSRDGGLQSPSTPSTTGSFSTMQTGFINSTVSGTNGSRDGEGEEGGKKKKQKKGNGQQYVCVTCGRTDSPEWRKGPRGPKTLCNACGLRWAKRAKRTDDVPIPYVQGQQGSQREGDGQDGTRGGLSSSGSSSRNSRGAPVPHAALSVTPPTTQIRPASTSGSSQRQPRQIQALQRPYEPPAKAPTPSPTHAAFPHPHPHSHTQAQMAFSPTSASVGPGHFVHHQRPMVSTAIDHQSHQHQQTANMQQTSPTSAHPHEYVLQSQAQAQTQSHPQSTEHYQAVYEQYQWPVGQQGEGQYQY